MSTYTIVADDTLWKIGVAHGLSADTETADMLAANPQLDGSADLQIGQVINLPNTGGGGQNNSDQEAALNIHNQSRREASQHGHGRSELVWDNDLANAAAQWANHMASTGQFQHSRVGGQGENLYAASNGASFADASQNWANEVRNYRGEPIGQGNFEAYGHYTQCVWPPAKRLGIATAKGGNGWTYVVGRYQTQQISGQTVW